MVDLGWYTPAGALEAHRRGELELVFPTIKHLEQLAAFATADALLDVGRRAARSSPSSRASDRPARPLASCCRASPAMPPKVSVRTNGSPGRRNRFAAIGVPIDSVGRAGGTEPRPPRVRAQGLLDRIGASDRGDLDVRIRGDVRDPETGVVGDRRRARRHRGGPRRGARRGRRRRAAARARRLLHARAGRARRAARRGRAAPGVAYVDGHVDVYDGRTSPTGEAADMPMGGRVRARPAAWVRAAGGPSAARRASSCSGARDPEEAARHRRRCSPASSRRSRSTGPPRCAPPGSRRRAAGRAGRLGAGFWIHLDVDVLDEEAMPATDYLMPGGLGWDELAELLAPLRGAGAGRAQPRLREPREGPAAAAPRAAARVRACCADRQLARSAPVGASRSSAAPTTDSASIWWCS